MCVLAHVLAFVLLFNARSLGFVEVFVIISEHLWTVVDSRERLRQF